MPDDDDTLDGLCDLDFEMGPDTTDELAPYVVLFADDLDCEQCVSDPIGLELHANQWRRLFSREAGP